VNWVIGKEKILTPLDGVDDRTAESFDDISQNMANKDGALDLFSECESMDCKKLHLIPEKVEIKQEIKNEELGEQDLVKEISNCERFSCNEVRLFDKTPQKKVRWWCLLSLERQLVFLYHFKSIWLFQKPEPNAVWVAIATFFFSLEASMALEI
jgi:hypothetical protein